MGTDRRVAARHQQAPSRLAAARSPLLLAAASLAVIAAIAGSPLLLILWENPKGINWSRLGEIGQAYDGTSAILSAIALLGVAASLIIQARQSLNERVQHTLDRQFNLLNLVLEKPGLYGPLAGWPHDDDDTARQHVFMSMWINVLQMRYEMNTPD
jgi:hypothetical protein